jgi:hypothetical protein
LSGVFFGNVIAALDHGENSVLKFCLQVPHDLKLVVEVFDAVGSSNLSIALFDLPDKLLMQE